MSQGGHSEQLLFFALFYQSTPSYFKVIGWVGGWGGVVAHVIIVSAQSKELGFWFFFDLRVRIWGLLGQGIGDFNSGLTINTRSYMISKIETIVFRVGDQHQVPNLLGWSEH